MAKRTIKERLLTGLGRRGWTVDPGAKSSRYVTLTHPDRRGRVYVGKAGSMRYGLTVASSVPADEEKAVILGEEE